MNFMTPVPPGQCAASRSLWRTEGNSRPGFPVPATSGSDFPMATPATSETGLARPSPDEALAAVRRIAKAWELDRHDTAALLGEPDGDLSTIEWTDERLLRVAYLIALETALVRLAPKT